MLQGDLITVNIAFQTSSEPWQIFHDPRLWRMCPKCGRLLPSKVLSPYFKRSVNFSGHYNLGLAGNNLKVQILCSVFIKGSEICHL